MHSFLKWLSFTTTKYITNAINSLPLKNHIFSRNSLNIIINWSMNVVGCPKWHLFEKISWPMNILQKKCRYKFWFRTFSYYSAHMYNIHKKIKCISNCCAHAYIMYLFIQIFQKWHNNFYDYFIFNSFVRNTK